LRGLPSEKAIVVGINTTDIQKLTSLFMDFAKYVSETQFLNLTRLIRHTTQIHIF
jgi:hypothetical protein